MPRYFDIHSHLNFKDYETDLDEVIGRLKDTDTYTIVVGTDYETSKQALELAEKHSGIYACIGIHPVDKPARVFDKAQFAELVKSSKVVAVGECGMDFYHTKKEDDYDRQKKLFLDQINFALEYDKPIMIHTRNAYEEILEILEPLKEMHGDNLRGNVHFFAGDLEVAKRFVNIGFTLSFTGVITFVRDYDEVVKNITLASIMSETDAPYVAPVPHRGKRNEPIFVSEVVRKIALIRGEPLETVQKALIDNVFKLFRISP